MDEFTANREITSAAVRDYVETENAIEVLIRSHDYACWYDKIEILARQDMKCLESLLLLDGLNRESYLIKIIDGSERAKKWRYNSKIIVTVPTPTFFELLYIDELSDCAIHYVEVALDIFFDSEYEAESACRSLQNHLRRKYCRTALNYDKCGSCEKISEKAKTERLFGKVTIYLGGKKNKLAIYARPSKFNERPCIHIEFRIRGEQVKKRTGIKSIADLIDFDPEDFFMREVKQVVSECINERKFGMWILKSLGKINNGKRKEMRISLAVTTFLSLFEIKTNIDLINYIKETYSGA
jgi:hypothetical protein